MPQDVNEEEDKHMKFFGKWLPLLRFKGSNDYWTSRYKLGGDSGRGSEGRAAEYKAQVLNRFVADHAIHSVIEFGCGDGRQLTIAAYPKYTGIDISTDAIARCRQAFASHSEMNFMLAEEYDGTTADLSMSLDVIYHLIEDDIYDAYLDHLFTAGKRYVAIYSTTGDAKAQTLKHVRHRTVDKDIEVRFPKFVRMTEYEDGLSTPVELGIGGPTRFLLYWRRGA